MNAQPEGTLDVNFELNSDFDVEKLRDLFRMRGRVRIRNLLRPDCANDLYQYLRQETPWRTFLVANEELKGTLPNEPNSPSVENMEDHSEFRTAAYEGARAGFACVFDADELFPEDIEESMPGPTGSVANPADARGGMYHTSLVREFQAFLASRRVTSLIGQISGLHEVEGLHVRAHAVRFQVGHFMTLHAGTWSADKTRKRRASFYFNLTPEWRPEWGGMLEFRAPEADLIEAYVPNFNTLDLFAFPQGHWISTVAPFAGGPVLGMAGRLYIP